MANQITVNVVSAEREIWSGKADMLVAKTAVGEIGLLAGHEPMLAVLVAGEIRMSAGTGVVHSEYNLENEETNLYQIWMFPNKKNVKPRWDAKQFPKEPVTDKLKPLVTGFDHPETDSLKIYQDAVIYAGRLKQGTVIEQTIKEQAYLLCSHGTFEANEVALKKGDGAEITDIHKITITAKSDCEVLLIDLPK